MIIFQNLKEETNDYVLKDTMEHVDLKTNSRGSDLRAKFDEVLKYFRHFFSNARFSAASEPHLNFSSRFTGSFGPGSTPSQGNSDVDSTLFPTRVVL